MKNKGGSHGFVYKDRGDDKTPIKAGRSGQNVPPNCGTDGHIVGKPSQGSGVNKAQAIQHDATVVGSLKKPKASSAQAINKLPSGGSHRIV